MCDIVDYGLHYTIAHIKSCYKYAHNSYYK